MELDLISLEGSALSNSEFLVVYGFGMALHSLSVNVQFCVPLLFSCWPSLLASLSSVSYLYPDMRRQKWLIIQLLSYCSLAQLFCREWGRLKMLLGGHGVIMQDGHAPPRTKPIRLLSVPLGHSSRWAMHLFRGVGLRLWYSWQISVIQDPRKTCVATGGLLTSWLQMPSLGPGLQQPLAFHLRLSCTCLSASRAINGSRLVSLRYCLRHNPLFCEHIMGQNVALGPSCGTGPLFLWCSQGFPILSVVCHISPLSVASWH